MTEPDMDQPNPNLPDASSLRIGVDLGGTKIEAAALDRTGKVHIRLRLPSPRHDYQATIETIAALIARVEAELQSALPARHARRAIGVGIPGSQSPQDGLIRNANATWLIGKPLAADLERRLNRPVRLANDANCFALSEAQDGAAKGAKTVFGVILGTGVGGGVVIDGVLRMGRNAIAGEWGHNPLPWPTPAELPGPVCFCGKQGCIETWLSGPGLSADYARGAQTEIGGDDLVPLTPVAIAAAGTKAAEAALLRYEDRLARALASVINILDPDVIVLGGGLSNLPRLYVNVPRRWARYVFSDVIATQLVPPQYGDSSGVRGAARLWDSD